MIPGVDHELTLTASTPGSGYYIDTVSFLTNIPPYGGNCSVDPLEGTFKIHSDSSLHAISRVLGVYKFLSAMCQLERMAWCT